ncbi:MAG: hypothetical protein LKJ93_07420, partial [Bacteroidales bacterium]|nr:hypothetical protein [Bacteroidales bacterium]
NPTLFPDLVTPATSPTAARTELQQALKFLLLSQCDATEPAGSRAGKNLRANLAFEWQKSKAMRRISRDLRKNPREKIVIKHMKYPEMRMGVRSEG